MTAVSELHIPKLVEQLERMLDERRLLEITSPFTPLLRDLRQSVPADITNAQQILEQRSQIIGAAQLEAARLITQETVVQDARQEAKKIIERAKTNAGLEAQKIVSQGEREARRLQAEAQEKARLITEEASLKRQKVLRLAKTLRRKVASLQRSLSIAEDEIKAHQLVS